MANVDQPFCGGNDTLRRGLRCHVPAVSYGQALAGDLLAVSLPEYHGHLASVPESIDVGRLCGFNLRDGFTLVLVCRFDPRLGNVARPQPEAYSTFHLRHVGDG